MTQLRVIFDLDERPFPADNPPLHTFKILATRPRLPLQLTRDFRDWWTSPPLEVQADLFLGFGGQDIPVGPLHEPRAARLTEVTGWDGDPVTALTLSPLDDALVRRLARERYYDPMYDTFCLDVTWEHL